MFYREAKTPTAAERNEQPLIFMKILKTENPGFHRADWTFYKAATAEISVNVEWIGPSVSPEFVALAFWDPASTTYESNVARQSPRFWHQWLS